MLKRAPGFTSSSFYGNSEIARKINSTLKNSTLVGIRSSGMCAIFPPMKLKQFELWDKVHPRFIDSAGTQPDPSSPFPNFICNVHFH